MNEKRRLDRNELMSRPLFPNEESNQMKKSSSLEKRLLRWNRGANTRTEPLSHELRKAVKKPSRKLHGFDDVEFLSKEAKEVGAKKEEEEEEQPIHSTGCEVGQEGGAIDDEATSEAGCSKQNTTILTAYSDSDQDESD